MKDKNSESENRLITHSFSIKFGHIEIQLPITFIRVLLVIALIVSTSALSLTVSSLPQMFKWALIGVLGSIATPFFEFLYSLLTKSFRKRVKHPNKSISYILNWQMTKKTLLTSILLLVTVLVLFFVLPAFIQLSSNAQSTMYQGYIFIFALIILINLRDSLMRYRIRKGYFGDNEYESRILIQFVLDNQKSIDFTDGGKGKKIISEEDLKSLEDLVPDISPVQAYKG